MKARRLLLAVGAVGLLACSSAAGGTFPGGVGLIAFAKTQGIVGFDPARGTERLLVANAGGPAWSPDGRRLAFAQPLPGHRYADTPGVFVANADGSDAVQVGEGYDPSWSPDGKELLVWRSDGIPRPNEPAGRFQIYVVDIATHAEQQLTTDGGTKAAWSPDGGTIAFAGADGIDGIGPGGGAVRTLVHAAGAGAPSWSPDGTRLAYLLRGQVWVAAADGGTPRQVTSIVSDQSSAPYVAPAWSPNGRWIAWADRGELCATDLAGNVQRLTYTGGGPPDWQPVGTDGRLVLVSEPRPGGVARLACGTSTPGVELMPDGPQPTTIVATEPDVVEFVNDDTRTHTIGLEGEPPVIALAPSTHGGYGLPWGTHLVAIGGYPDGERIVTVVVRPGGGVVVDPSPRAVVYGTRTTLHGSTTRPQGGETPGEPSPGSLVVWARPAGVSYFSRVATLDGVDGFWSVPIAPRATTLYRIVYKGSLTAERTVTVRARLRVVLHGRELRVEVGPARSVAWLQSLRGGRWGTLYALRGAGGVMHVRGLHAGVYRVVVAATAHVARTTSPAFSVRG